MLSCSARNYMETVFYVIHVYVYVNSISAVQVVKKLLKLKVHFNAYERTNYINYAGHLIYNCNVRTLS